MCEGERVLVSGRMSVFSKADPLTKRLILELNKDQSRSVEAIRARPLEKAFIDHPVDL